MQRLAHPFFLSLPDIPDPAVATQLPERGDNAVPLAELLKKPVKEIGGRKDGPDPTRYGDWEKNGRCIDF